MTAKNKCNLKNKLLPTQIYIFFFKSETQSSKSLVRGAYYKSDFDALRGK